MMAGVLGMDWKVYTLRVLWVMFQSRIQDQWDHTSRMMAAVYQSLGGSKKTSLYYHPFRKDTKAEGDSMRITPKTLPILAKLIITAGAK